MLRCERRVEEKKLERQIEPACMINGDKQIKPFESMSSLNKVLVLLARHVIRGEGYAIKVSPRPDVGLVLPSLYATPPTTEPAAR